MTDIADVKGRVASAHRAATAQVENMTAALQASNLVDYPTADRQVSALQAIVHGLAALASTQVAANIIAVAALERNA